MQRVSYNIQIIKFDNCRMPGDKIKILMCSGSFRQNYFIWSILSVFSNFDDVNFFEFG